MMRSLALAAIVCVLFMAPAAAGASDEREALEKPAPVYPVAALNAEIEGEVVLSIDIAANGNVTALRLVSVDKPGIGFEASAKEAVARWRYKPAAGATSDVRVVVNFKLTEDEVPCPGPYEMPQVSSPMPVDVQRVMGPDPQSSKTAPNYPAAAYMNDVEGVVVLFVDIAQDGHVNKTAIFCVSPKGYGFETAAAAAVRQWRYRPYEGERNNIRIVVRFALR